MATRKVSPLRKEKTLQTYDELNKLLVPIAALRFELAGWTKQGIHEYPLGDLLLTINMLINQKEE
jgi:hypothetical protein